MVTARRRFALGAAALILGSAGAVHLGCGGDTIVALSAIEGVVTSPASTHEPAAYVPVRLEALGTDPNLPRGTVVGRTVTDASGAYSFAQVPSGQTYAAIADLSALRRLGAVVFASGASVQRDVTGTTHIAYVACMHLLEDGEEPEAIDTALVGRLEEEAAALASSLDFADADAVDTAADTAVAEVTRDFDGQWEGTWAGWYKPAGWLFSVPVSGTWKATCTSGVATGVFYYKGAVEGSGSGEVSATGSMTIEGSGSGSGGGFGTFEGRLERETPSQPASASGTFESSPESSEVTSGTWEGQRIGLET